ncbi:MAG: zinc-ribbon domain-containing protein [Candidatus Lokiarchaeia archaeon]|nr:zinc-ribbon domain-containing protein [Candidatus Lokiarchaeia archaeon]
MLFCPKCGARNKTTYNYCRRCGTKIKYSAEDIKPIKQEASEYKINDFITLKLEKDNTVIYVNDEKFLQCKYLLIEIPKDKINEFDDFMSIDELSEKLDHSLEKNVKPSQILPEIEFWGHCSNLQAWAENNYDTNLLHSNLAFPLLKKLTDVGDPIARRIFKEEIAERLTNIFTNVAQYLIQENYLEYFSKEEYEIMMEILFTQIEQQFRNKQSSLLEEKEINALLDIIETNLIHSKIFLTNRLKSIEKINSETHLGFLHDNKRVITLGLNRCGIEVLPSSIENLENLEELYLTENRLNYLPSSLGNLTKLKKVDLSDNHLIELPIEIGNLIALKELHLNHNVIQNLPDTISNLKILEILSVWGNQLKKFPKNVNEMESLRVLGLSFNQLEELPKISYEIPNLEVLDLSNNKIHSLPDNMDFWKSLKTLWLNNNPLTTIPMSLLDLQNLTDIYTINTKIFTNQDTETIKVLKKLKMKGVNIWK